MVNRATNGSWEKLTIDILWHITKNVTKEFTVTYERASGFVPSKFLDENGPLNYVMFPILAYHYSMWRNEFIVVQRTGACSEFATTITTLLRDIAKTPTRKIVLQGIDHVLPEVYFKGEWWVFDIFYTTQNKPVKAETYATHLKHERNGFDKYVSRMLAEETGLDVTREHGFNTTTLTIKAIIDVVTPPTEDTPAANAEVEIFALENLYDPLVAKGKTNTQGYYTIELNGGKNYIVIVKHNHRGYPLIGVSETHLPENKCKTIQVKLHPYG